MSKINMIRRGISYGKAHGGSGLMRKTLEHGRNKAAQAGYESWLAAHLPSAEQLEMQRRKSLKAERKFSVLVPVYRTPENFLREMVESVLGQSYPNLELCLADASAEHATERIIREYARKDARVRYLRLEENRGIAGNTNAALAAADGEFICLLDHDDLLTPDALYEMNRLLDGDLRLDAVYSDEDKVDLEGRRHFCPHFKPDFNLDLLRSNNYICHLFCVRTELARSVGGFRRAYDGAQDYDFILRCVEKARAVGHIPKILYHWRSHPASTADNPESKRYAYEAGKHAVEEHLRRCGLRGRVYETNNPGFYRVRYFLAEWPQVTVLVRGRFSKEDAQWLKTRLAAATEYPGLTVCVGEEAVRVLQKRLARGQKRDGYLLFLHPGCYPENRGWVKELVSHAARKGTGCVGGRIYGEDHRLLHGCEVIGMYGLAAASPFRGYFTGFYGYMHKIGIQQNVSVAAGECLMVSEQVLARLMRGEAARELFLEEDAPDGGESGQLAGEERWDPRKIDLRGWNIELCLKAQRLGLVNCYTPFAVLTLRGAKTEGPVLSDYRIVHAQAAWAGQLEGTDPAYNCNLSLRRGGYARRQPGE